MIKRMAFLLSIIICILVAGNYIYNNTFVNKRDSVGLAVVYGTVEELYSNAEVVVKGEFLGTPKPYDIEASEDNHVMYWLLYDFSITEVINNTTDIELEEKDTIYISRLISFSHNNNNNLVKLIEDKDIKMEHGTYLLFLNTIYDETLGEYMFVNNSPNHLYKARSILSGYENVVQRHDLRIITEADVLKMNK
ncbi:hypothetical protein [Alkaliphilus transvaalensis]|uniref:hypothetical protein n=1 Tax=Alkaliphilus transvaalensis TaxID=114628 RepID=UPI00047CC33C|nr:hypothetical protein [Alkaliphilus transvaalensis]